MLQKLCYIRAAGRSRLKALLILCVSLFIFACHALLRTRPARLPGRQEVAPVADDRLLSVGEREFAVWLHELDYHLLVIREIARICEAHYHENRPKSGTVDLVRLAVEPRE